MTIEKKNAIGCNLKKILAQRGMAQKQISEDLKISKQAVSNLCAERFLPSIEQALRISAYLNMPLEEIFYLKENEEI